MSLTTSANEVAPAPATMRKGRLGQLQPIEPLHLLGAVFFVVVLVKVASAPLIDPDAPWHVRLGSQLLSGIPPTQAGHSWTFAPIDDTHWVSTQWLAEMLMASLHSAMGWNGLLVLRAAIAAALLGLLAVTLIPGRPARTAIPVFMIAASPLLMVAVQERPQSLSYLPLVPVSWWARGIVTKGRLPSVWWVLPLSIVWANIHGLWILLPAVIVLAAVSRWTDHGPRDQIARRAIGLATLSLACGLISPDGIGTVTAVLRFHDAARLIDEWQPVSLFSVSSAPLVLWSVLIISAWARSRIRPPRSELVFVGSLLLFGLTAYRNIPTVLILTAPFVIVRVNIAWHPSRSVTSERERRWLVRIAALTVVAGLVAAMTTAAVRAPLPKDAPLSLIQKVAGRAEGARILPEYNESGLVLTLAGPESKTAIDGRADLFGAPYITRYMTMLDAGYGWESTVRDLNPTSAILLRTTNLAKELQRCGWQVEASTPTHLLLVPTPGWTCPPGG